MGFTPVFKIEKTENPVINICIKKINNPSTSKSVTLFYLLKKVFLFQEKDERAFFGHFSLKNAFTFTKLSKTPLYIITF